MRIFSFIIVFVIVLSSLTVANTAEIVNLVGKFKGEKNYLMILSKGKIFLVKDRVPEGVKEGDYVEVKGVERTDKDGNNYIWALQVKKIIPRTIEDTLKDIKNYLGKKVLITGEFRGWEGNAGPPPVTRSDWVVSDKTGYIYVLGAPPFNPIEDKGKKILVIGTLKVSRNNIPYIEPIIVEER
ncbi:MAG: hypothetical protein N2380_05765 [bacterium]|nr:hypothetical protein [bacterium]